MKRNEWEVRIHLPLQVMTLPMVEFAIAIARTRHSLILLPTQQVEHYTCKCVCTRKKVKKVNEVKRSIKVKKVSRKAIMFSSWLLGGIKESYDCYFKI